VLPHTVDVRVLDEMDSSVALKVVSENEPEHSMATLHGKVGEDMLTAEVNITGLAGFLLAKAAAARSRRKPKDWYDAVRISLDNLAANFPLAAHQGLCVRSAKPGVRIPGPRDPRDDRPPACEHEEQEAEPADAAAEHRVRLRQPRRAEPEHGEHRDGSQRAIERRGHRRGAARR